MFRSPLQLREQPCQRGAERLRRGVGRPPGTSWAGSAGSSLPEARTFFPQCPIQSAHVCWRTCATNWGLARTRRQPSRGPDVPSLAGGQAIPGARRRAPRRRRFRLPLRRGQASYQANGRAVSSRRAGRPCRDGEERGRERQLHKERSAVYAIEYGGRKLVTSDPGDGVGYPVPMRTPLGRSLPARRLTCDLLPRLCGSLHLAYPDAHAPRAGPSSPQKMSTFGCAPFSLARHE